MGSLDGCGDFDLVHFAALEQLVERDNSFVVEAFTRTADDQLQYKVTIDDPHTFERPWTAVLYLAPQKEMFEYACHEGNRGLENILRAARFEEARGRDAAPAR